MKKVALICLVLIGLLVVGCQEEQLTKACKSGVKKYEPTWESLRKYKEIPEYPLGALCGSRLWIEHDMVFIRPVQGPGGRGA